MASAIVFAKKPVNAHRSTHRHPTSVSGFLWTETRLRYRLIPAASPFLKGDGGSRKVRRPCARTSLPRLFTSPASPRTQARLKGPPKLCDCWTLFVEVALLSLRPSRPSLGLPQAGIRRHPDPLHAKSSIAPAPFKRCLGPPCVERLSHAGRCLKAHAAEPWSPILWSQFR